MTSEEAYEAYKRQMKIVEGNLCRLNQLGAMYKQLCEQEGKQEKENV
jgi:hypothetical protein